ncbi:MAG: mRNA surveillance protein Pelota [Thaumarchaeota archaeon]|nr:mRNA surveillance protein Pelota [Nitrososphaerota archaeon]
MIISRFQRNIGLAVVQPEDLQDLWTLRRIISPGDEISGETTRVIKVQGEFTRPDKGQRISVRISMEVESVKLEGMLERLRISGTIVEVSEEFLSKGSHHSMNVSMGFPLVIKKRTWQDFEAKLLQESSKSSERFLLVAIDSRDAAVGVLSGTHLKILPQIESGISGKMYEGLQGSLAQYMAKVKDALQIIHKEGNKIIVFGPGQTKNAFANFLSKDTKLASLVQTVEGIDLSGEDGLFVALKSHSLKRVFADATIARVQAIAEEGVKRIARNDGRVVVSLKETLDATKAGAVEAVLVSSKLFEKGDESSIVELLNATEKFGGKTYLVDSSTDTGNQVDVMGGVLGLLRYSTYKG